MHQRIVLTASALVLLVVALASFFSMRITMQEEQGILQEQLLNAARYAAASAQDEAALNRVAALMNARVTRMDRSGEILYDTSGQVGYYLDQPDVVTALSNGTGTEISFQGRLAQMQIAVSVLDDDGTILRITRSQVVFRHGNWGLFAALMMLVLVVCIYLSFALARRIVTPINQISKAAQAIIDGNYNVNLRIDGYAELNQLLRTLQSMNTRLQETVEKLRAFYPSLEAVESVIACGLSSLNPIIHVPGCILNAGRIEYAKGEFYFYTEGFTPCVARTTEAIDKERIALLDSFGYASDIVAHGVGGSIITDDIGEAIASDPNFAKIKGPADTNSRYYAEDIPYGLAPWAKLARAMNVDVPVIGSMITIGSALLGYDCWTKGHSLQDLGIEGMTKEELKEYLETGK